jgi:hypothetical protein
MKAASNPLFRAGGATSFRQVLAISSESAISMAAITRITPRTAVGMRW